MSRCWTSCLRASVLGGLLMGVLFALHGCNDAQLPANPRLQLQAPTHHWDEYEVSVRHLPPEQVRERCAEWLDGAHVMGCAIWLEGSQRGVVFMPPPEALAFDEWNRLMGHEIRHVARGKWHR